MAEALLVVSLLGLTTSTIYAGMVVVAALRFAARRRATRLGLFTPAVSVLKPLHGYEPGLEARLESFFQQQYTCFELLFCARVDADAGLEVARKVAARYPLVSARFLVAGVAPYANAKVWSLETMQAVATHSILVVSDSDVGVEPGYLRAVVASFADERVGLVTCLYRGVVVGPGGVWPRLEAVGMSVEMSSGVLAAEMVEGMKFALGPTMAVRDVCLRRAGGFSGLGNYHGDDFMLGSRVAATGFRVLLSTHPVEHHILRGDWEAMASRQVRWMRGTRFYRPWGHAGTVLTYSLPFGLLAGVAGLAGGWPLPGAACVAWSVGTRILLAWMVARMVVEEQHAWYCALLYPLRELLGFGFWLASYLGRQVTWREERFQLFKDGRFLIVGDQQEAKQFSTRQLNGLNTKKEFPVTVRE